MDILITVLIAVIVIVGVASYFIIQKALARKKAILKEAEIEGEMIKKERILQAKEKKLRNNNYSTYLDMRKRSLKADCQALDCVLYTSFLSSWYMVAAKGTPISMPRMPNRLPPISAARKVKSGGSPTEVPTTLG